MAENGGRRPGAGRPKGSVSDATRIKIALRQKFAKMGEERAEEIFGKLFELAMQGKEKSLHYLIDQLMDKASQSVLVGEDENNPIHFHETMKLIAAKYAQESSTMGEGDAAVSDQS